VRFSDRFRLERDEPLAALFRPREAAAALAPARESHFEYTSRGDRVTARLLLPPARGGRAPLVLVGHGGRGSKNSPYVDAAVGPWLRAGAAVAAIDLPLHGERASAKLSEQLLAGLALGTDARHEALWLEFAAQSVLDLERALDALAGHAEVDVGRAAYAGFSLGAMLGALFCAGEPRIRAAALAIGGGGFGPSAADPVRHIARFAPRPLLFVNATRDERIPRANAEALHAAAGEPKQVLWFECGHGDLPGRALKAMWQFLHPHLGLR
jgi:dienelactone hydrolase